MIDTVAEQPIPLSLAAREAPNRQGGRGISAATTWRWYQRGVKGVRLETVMCGGIRMTSREAVARFFAAVTAAASGKCVSPRSSHQRQLEIKAAEEELRNAGI